MENFKYDLTYDVAFKKCYKDKANLANLLSVLFGEEINKNEIEYKSIESNNSIEAKLARYDIRIGLLEKEIDIEMQKENEDGLIERMLYYTCSLIVSSVKSSGEYKDVKECIGIWFLNFNIAKMKDRCIKEFYLKCEETILSKKFKIILINLQKIEKCDNIRLREYLGLMKNRNVEKCLNSEDPIIKELAKYMDKMTEREYQERLDFERTDDRLRCNQLRNEGEVKKQKEMILSLYSQNVSLEVIATASKLTIEEVKNIVEESNIN